MSHLRSLPAAEAVGWYVHTKRTDEDRDGYLLGDYGCGHAAGASRSTLAAIAAEAINATRETGVGPAEMRRQRDELLAALKRVGCQDSGSCGAGEPDGLCFVCAAIARAEGKS